MSTVQRQRQTREVEYPSGDGKPMAETEIHLEAMIDCIQVLKDHFTAQPNVYVGGNLLLYYVRGNPRKHISPDVLVTVGVPKEPPRDYYLVWNEGKAPDFVIEITSKSTKQEDKKKKFEIYRDILRVSELFLFDPTKDYLDPRSRASAWRWGNMFPSSRSPAGCPAGLLGLHLERDGTKFACTIREWQAITDTGRGSRRRPNAVPTSETEDRATPRPGKPHGSVLPRRTSDCAGDRGPPRAMTGIRRCDPGAKTPPPESNRLPPACRERARPRPMANAAPKVPRHAKPVLTLIRRTRFLRPCRTRLLDKTRQGCDV